MFFFHLKEEDGDSFALQTQGLGTGDRGSSLDQMIAVGLVCVGEHIQWSLVIKMRLPM